MREPAWKEEVPKEAVLTPRPVEKAVPVEGCITVEGAVPLEGCIIVEGAVPL